MHCPVEYLLISNLGMKVHVPSYCAPEASEASEASEGRRQKAEGNNAGTFDCLTVLAFIPFFTGRLAMATLPFAFLCSIDSYRSCLSNMVPTASGNISIIFCAITLADGTPLSFQLKDNPIQS